jgi:hypothetical protein
LTGYHFLSSGNWFYAGVGNMLQSSTQKIAILGNVGPGLGVFLRNTDRTRFSLLGGLVLQSTDYSVPTFPAGTRRIAAGLVAADLSVFKFKKTNLNIRASLFPAVSNPDRGRLYFDTNASYYLKIIGNLSWTLSFYGNWDTRPPSHLPEVTTGRAPASVGHLAQGELSFSVVLESLTRHSLQLSNLHRRPRWRRAFYRRSKWQSRCL